MKKLVIIAVGGLILLILCWLVLLRAAYLQGGDSLVTAVKQTQAVGRITGDSRTSWLYYWINSFSNYSVTYPIALFILIYKFKDIVNKKNDGCRLLGCLGLWIIIVLAGLSIPDTKHTRYALPIVPAISLASAYLFIDESSQGKLFQVRKFCTGLCYASPMIALCIGLACTAFSIYRAYQWHSLYAVALLVMGCLVFAAKWIGKNLIHPLNKNFAALTIAVVTLITLQLGIIEPLRYELESTGPFIEKTTSLAGKYNGKIAFFKIDPYGEAVKFIVNSKSPLSPEFVSDASALLNDSNGTCYIAKQEDFEELPAIVALQMHVLYHGFIGHKKCVVFVSLLPDAN